MHELSIAEAVIAIASRHAGDRQVIKVEMRIGHLRQVVPSALQFGFELLTKGTPLDGAELVIEDVPVRGRCRECDVETTMAGFPLQCSRCGSCAIEMVAGDELLVDALEVEDEENRASGERAGSGAPRALTTEGMTNGG